MTALRYKALDLQGRTVTGVMEADDERQLRQRLRQQNLRPLMVTVATGMESGSGWRHLLKSRRRLSVNQLSLLTRQLASLIKSGLPVDEVLRLTSEQSRGDHIKGLLAQVRSRVMEGQSLAQAMSEHPGAFDRMYCAMVRAGESAGFLGEVLERLALHTENSQQTRQKLQTALIYPLVLMGVSISVVVLLMTFVVPRLVSMFASSNRDLPVLTQVLINVSDFFRSGWALLLLIAVLAAIAGFKAWLRRSDNRLTWHSLLLRVPGLSNTLLQMDCARFASTMAILLGSGVPLLDALRIASEVLNNEQLRRSALAVAGRVQEGASFSKSLQQEEVFPALLVQMAANGEANGTLATQLDYAAGWQSRELDVRLGTPMALLEPLTIVLMGGLITLIMLAVLLPVFDMSSLI
ncbi:MAG: type II secretion system inner membrane protein GspF [Pseudohongiella sp.]|nr:type II secretion system inner membrane protein GspF [Pseudohongiella sp.]